jgi:hypothetical protein
MADMTDDDLEFERQLARDRRELRARKAASAPAEQASARSEAVGGPLSDAGDQRIQDLREVLKEQQDRESAQRFRPPFLPPLAPVDEERIARERAQIATVGGEAEGTYAETREGFIPFLRPTRIEEVQDAPSTVTSRVVREQAPFPYRLGETIGRPATARDELVESFARQPVMTMDAARALAAGADVPDRKVGRLDGATFESPLGAAFRALPASVEGTLTEAYRNLPRKETTPVVVTPTGLARAAVQAGAGAFEDTSALLSKYLAKLPGAAGEFGAGLAAGIGEVGTQRIRQVESAIPEAGLERPLIAGGIKAAKTGIRALELLDGQVEPGEAVRDLESLGSLTPVLPAPRMIPDKPIAQRIREGEFFLDVIQEDKDVVKVYDQEFGVLSPAAQMAMGLGLGMGVPFTPIGVVAKVTAPLKIGATATKAVTGVLTKNAMAKAEKALASRVFQDLTQSNAPVPMNSLDLDKMKSAILDSMRTSYRLPPGTLEIDAVLAKAEAAGKIVRVPGRAQEQFDGLVRRSIDQAKADLARVAPRTDLVRVAPSYAVPASIAPKVALDAAADVKAAREAMAAQGQALTRAQEAGLRDAAVARAAQAEARRLDELGQFQVLLDGLSTPRAWDTDLFRAGRAAMAPEQAMKRASVVAAEQEVARQGMGALRAIRKEFEAGSKAGKSADDILGEIGTRELAAMSGEERLKKVLEEAYGGPAANNIFNQLKNSSYVRYNVLRPQIAKAMHNELAAAGTVPKWSVPPNFAANSLKIILEEGVRKRVSKRALDEYRAAYPNSPTPTLAVLNKGGATLEEVKFFENGAEDMFKLADSIPTRAQGMPLSTTEGLERLASAARTVRQNARVPLVSEAKLLAGERFSAPVRAFLTTRYGIPSGLGEKVGVSTPYGFLRPADLNQMVDGMGGFGPSQMDIARKGLLANDFLLAASKGAGNRALDVAMGRQMAYATADAMEEGFRRAVFAKALGEGKPPEAAMTLARRSQFDYGSVKDSQVIEALAPYWAGVVGTAAAGAEFIDRTARNPALYGTYLRALRAQQKVHDPEGEQGDAPLTRFYAPMTEGMSKDIFGRELDVLGPNAPYLSPMTAPITIARGIQGGADVVSALLEGRLIEDALGGSAEALDELADKAGSLASGFSGDYEPGEANSIKRTGPKLTVDQTYLATLALAKASDPEGVDGTLADTLSFLAPDPVAPPKRLAAYPAAGSLAWSVRPPEAKGAFIFSAMEDIPGYDEKREVFYLLKPSAIGRQRIQAASTMIPGGAEDLIRGAGARVDAGLGEGILWTIGAETSEEPTKRAIERFR